MTVAREIAAKVEAFVRGEIVPYQRDPRRGPARPHRCAGRRDEAKARACEMLTPHIRPDGSHLTQRETALVLRMSGLSPPG